MIAIQLKISVEEFIELGEKQDPSLAEPDPFLPAYVAVKEGKGSGSARLVTPAGKQVGESESSDKPLLPPAGSAAPHIQHTQHTHLQCHYSCHLNKLAHYPKKLLKTSPLIELNV